jgi:hypothetical protein
VQQRDPALRAWMKMDDIRTAENLDEETRKRIDDVLSAEVNLAFEKVFQFDVELTNTVFSQMLALQQQLWRS